MESCGLGGTSSISTALFNQANFDFITDQAALVGETLSTVNNLEDFCLDDPVKVDANPTPFPTFAVGAAWTCSNISNFGSSDGCHCNCGVPDPDCGLDKVNIFNCGDSQICNDVGLCEDEAEAEGDDNTVVIIVITVVVFALVAVLVAAFFLTKGNKKEPVTTEEELEEKI